MGLERIEQKEQSILPIRKIILCNDVKTLRQYFSSKEGIPEYYDESEHMNYLHIICGQEDAIDVPFDSLRLLVEETHLKKRINDAMVDGNTPLHYAGRNLKLVKYLLENGAIPSLEMKDNSDDTPLFALSEQEPFFFAFIYSVLTSLEKENFPKYSEVIEKGQTESEKTVAIRVSRETKEKIREFFKNNVKIRPTEDCPDWGRPLSCMLRRVSRLETEKGKLEWIAWREKRKESGEENKIYNPTIYQLEARKKFKEYCEKILTPYAWSVAHWSDRLLTDDEIKDMEQLAENVDKEEIAHIAKVKAEAEAKIPQKVVEIEGASTPAITPPASPKSLLATGKAKTKGEEWEKEWMPEFPPISLFSTQLNKALAVLKTSDDVLAIGTKGCEEQKEEFKEFAPKVQDCSGMGVDNFSPESSDIEDTPLLAVQHAKPEVTKPRDSR